jgi:hypothetical protein
VDNTLRQLEKAKLALQTLARHNGIIVDATQHLFNESESSIRWLIDRGIANTLAIEMQHRQLVALEPCVDKVNKEGITTVGQHRQDVDNVKS